MSKKKKPIPILDDVVRTGNTDKAVEGGIDPYPRKLAPRKQKVKVSADSKPPADKLTDQYAKKITKKSTPSEAKAKPKKADQSATPPPPVLTEKVQPEKQASRPAAKPAKQKSDAKAPNADVEIETLELQPIIDKIVEEMVPDLEQHIRLQLRFELEKHLPRTIATVKDKDDK